MDPFVYIILAHFVADFLLQTREMGVNKSTSFYWLSVHLGAYLIGMSLFVFTLVFKDPMTATMYVLINFILHYITDFFTSKASTHFYKKNNMGMFWHTIGFDQTIHGLCLYQTFKLFSMQNFTTDLQQHVTHFPLILQILLGLVFVAAIGFALYSLGRMFWNLIGGSIKKIKTSESELTEK